MTATRAHCGSYPSYSGGRDLRWKPIRSASDAAKLRVIKRTVSSSNRERPDATASEIMKSMTHIGSQNHRQQFAKAFCCFYFLQAIPQPKWGMSGQNISCRDRRVVSLVDALTLTVTATSSRPQSIFLNVESRNHGNTAKKTDRVRRRSRRGIVVRGDNVSLDGVPCGYGFCNRRHGFFRIFRRSCRSVRSQRHHWIRTMPHYRCCMPRFCGCHQDPEEAKRSSIQW